MYSDLTCTKKYALTEGPKRGGGGELMWATRSVPPVILCLLRACNGKGNVIEIILNSSVQQKEYFDTKSVRDQNLRIIILLNMESLRRRLATLRRLGDYS